jgi:hypothetical protein
VTNIRHEDKEPSQSDHPCRLCLVNSVAIAGDADAATLDGTRSRAIRGATGVKSGVKSGGFWQPLSQDVALSRNVVHATPLPAYSAELRIILDS